uniref:30S ribosomal protein S2 n=1 Tax=Trebonia sp. TaxID=2767075 RepID=UPI0026311851
RDMSRVPSAIWVVDTKKEHIAVSEARKLGIPVVAILDTNCDPDEVSYPIPGNDDAIRSVALLTRVVADAVADGLIARAGAAEGDQKPSDDEFSSEEPLPEWERDLLEGNGAGAGVIADDVVSTNSATAEAVAEAEDDEAGDDAVADAAIDEAGDESGDAAEDDEADDE